MKRTLLFLACFAVVGLAGCQKPAQSASYSGGFNVEKLFTVDDCTVYRFMDDRTVYFTNCHGTTSYQRNCGKGCTENVTVPGNN